YATGTGPAMLAPGPSYRQRGGPPRRAARGRDTMQGRGSGTGRVLGIIAAILVIGAVGAGGWVLRHPGSGSTAPPPPRPRAAPTAVAAGGPVRGSAVALGPNGGANVSQANLAIDKQSGTSWTTDSYRGSPRFGNLYGGTGLMLDMGRRVKVSSVTVTF